MRGAAQIELTPRFELDAEASKATPWLELLQQATIDVDDAMGKTHSSDEGLV